MTRRQILLSVLMCGSLAFTAGCATLEDPDGKAVSLKAYDSVIVEEVRIDPEVSTKELGPLMKGMLQIELLTGDKWKLGTDFDFDEFSQYVEKYATVPGTLNGKPFESAMPVEKFKEKYAKKKEKMGSSLDKPKGVNPLRLQVVITKLDFPGTIDKVVTGRSAQLHCQIWAYDVNSPKPLGSATVTAADKLPGMPILPISMGLRIAKKVIFGGYTRKHVLKLTENLSKEIVKVLDKAKDQ